MEPKTTPQDKPHSGQDRIERLNRILSDINPLHNLWQEALQLQNKRVKEKTND